MALQDLWVKWLERELGTDNPAPPEDTNMYYVVEDSFVDTTTQNPASPDVPITVKFGAAKTSPNGLVSVDANGVLSVLKSGPYAVKSRIQCTRLGASGTSFLHLWIEASMDGGTSWMVSGNIVDIRLDSATDTDVFFDFTPLFLPVGAKARTRFVRSSLGTNSGQIASSPLSTALQTYGLVPTSAAQLSVYRLENYPY